MLRLRTRVDLCAATVQLRSANYWHSLQKTAGYALVEFAFALMILLMLTFVMIDVGSALYAANVVQSAAQTGARTGIINEALVVPTVYTQLGGLNPLNAQVNVVLVDHERIDVEVRYQYELITPLAQFVENGSIILTGKASMLIY